MEKNHVMVKLSKREIKMPVPRQKATAKGEVVSAGLMQRGAEKPGGRGRSHASQTSRTSARDTRERAHTRAHAHTHRRTRTGAHSRGRGENAGGNIKTPLSFLKAPSWF